MEQPPPPQDVGFGEDQLGARDLVVHRDRRAPLDAGVDGGEAEGLVALVADDPLPLVPEATLVLGAGLAGIEGALDLARVAAPAKEVNLLVAGVEELEETDLLWLQIRHIDPHLPPAVGRHDLEPRRVEPLLRSHLGPPDHAEDGEDDQHTMNRFETTHRGYCVARAGGGQVRPPGAAVPAHLIPWPLRARPPRTTYR